MLTLRVRMPIVENLVYPRNFITKIIKYDKVRCCRTAVGGAPCNTLHPSYPCLKLSEIWEVCVCVHPVGSHPTLFSLPNKIAHPASLINPHSQPCRL